MEDHRARLEGDRRVTSTGDGVRPLRLLLSSAAVRDLSARVTEALGGASWLHVLPGDVATDFDVAFVSRDVTGLSTKHEVQPATRCSTTRCSRHRACDGCTCIRREPTGLSM